jgi:hypothetical protein
MTNPVTVFKITALCILSLSTLSLGAAEDPLAAFKKALSVEALEALTKPQRKRAKKLWAAIQRNLYQTLYSPSSQENMKGREQLGKNMKEFFRLTASTNQEFTQIGEELLQSLRKARPQEETAEHLKLTLQKTPK